MLQNDTSRIIESDPLDVIASGPTVADSSTPAEALAVLERFDGAKDLPSSIFAYLEKARAAQSQNTQSQDESPRSLANCQITNLIIGNNALAVDAAGVEAERLGYSHAMQSATAPEGFAEDIGRHLAQMALSMRDPDTATDRPNCLISGGEPVVKLADSSIRGSGGRNQQLVLAALELLREKTAPDNLPTQAIAILSGGTDGEDGPTDAAGAFLDETIITSAANKSLNPKDYLHRNDAYNFFGPLGALIKTGPTHTNVCDLRVVVVER